VALALAAVRMLLDQRADLLDRSEQGCLIYVASYANPPHASEVTKLLDAAESDTIGEGSYLSLPMFPAAWVRDDQATRALINPE
jgi:hypothetical protein